MLAFYCSVMSALFSDSAFSCLVANSWRRSSASLEHYSVKVVCRCSLWLAQESWSCFSCSATRLSAMTFKDKICYSVTLVHYSAKSALSDSFSEEHLSVNEDFISLRLSSNLPLICAVKSARSSSYFWMKDYLNSAFSVAHCSLSRVAAASTFSWCFSFSSSFSACF